MHIDHRHKDEKVRGVICANCNLAIGHLNESVDRALAVARYLDTNGDEVQP